MAGAKGVELGHRFLIRISLARVGPIPPAHFGKLGRYGAQQGVDCRRQERRGLFIPFPRQPLNFLL